MNKDRYIVVEFNDGLQLIPAEWFNADKSVSIWPSHFKTKLRINKAIITKEMLKEKSDWDTITVKRVFAIANSYDEGLNKLTLAEDTSNVETNLSSNEFKEKDKKKRRLRAVRRLSSSSEDFNSDEENTRTTTQRKSLPSFPLKQNFVLSDKELNTSRHKNTKDIPVLRENTLCNVVNKNDISVNDIIRDDTQFLKTSSLHEENENIEFRKVMLQKMNKILYKLITIENKFDLLQEKMQYKNQFCTQESNIEFPIHTMSDLTLFEEQLENTKFKEDVLKIFQHIGGNSAHYMIRNILKKAITDNFATNFNWTGKKDKQCFNDLQLSKVAIRAVRLQHADTTDKEFAESVSKWLAQAPIRIQRQKSEAIDQNETECATTSSNVQ